MELLGTLLSGIIIFYIIVGFIQCVQDGSPTGFYSNRAPDPPTPAEKSEARSGLYMFLAWLGICLIGPMLLGLTNLYHWLFG